MAQSPYGTESPQEAPHRTTVLENFSFAQVIASALAAVTSVLLSQQIGVIGGMLGTAAGAAAATIAIQLYRGILDVSAERIREQITPVASDLTTRMAPQPTAEETVELKGAHLGDQPTEVMPSPAPASAPEPRIASDTLITRRAEIERHSRLRVTATVVAISLVTVAIVALIINFATAGEGLGERVVIMQEPAVEEQVDEETSEPLEETEATEKTVEQTPEEPADTTDETVETHEESTEPSEETAPTDGQATDASTTPAEPSQETPTDAQTEPQPTEETPSSEQPIDATTAQP